MKIVIWPHDLRRSATQEEWAGAGGARGYGADALDVPSPRGP